VALTWEQYGNGWRGFDPDGYVIATVVYYDTYGGHWAAFVRLEPVPGRHDTADAAKAAAELAHHAAPPPR
jgi:hypothetical protein